MPSDKGFRSAWTQPICSFTAVRFYFCLLNQVGLKLWTCHDRRSSPCALKDRGDAEGEPDTGDGSLTRPGAAARCLWSADVRPKITASEHRSDQGVCSSAVDAVKRLLTQTHRPGRRAAHVKYSQFLSMNRSWRAFSPAHGFTNAVGLLPKRLHFYWCFSLFGTFFGRSESFVSKRGGDFQKFFTKFFTEIFTRVSATSKMDFVWLAGFVMTICQLALQIRGDEGEFNLLRLHGSAHPGHVKCREVYSDGPDLCDTVLKRELWCSQQCFKGKRDPCFILQSKIQS